MAALARPSGEKLSERQCRRHCAVERVGLETFNVNFHERDRSLFCRNRLAALLPLGIRCPSLGLAEGGEAMVDGGDVDVEPPGSHRERRRQVAGVGKGGQARRICVDGPTAPFFGHNTVESAKKINFRLLPKCAIEQRKPRPRGTARRQRCSCKPGPKMMS